MKGRILTADLKRMVSNIRLYALKSSSTHGGSLWIRGATSIRAVSSDDFVILTDEAPVSGHDDASYNVMSYTFLEGLNKRLDGEDSEYFDLEYLEFEELPEVKETLVEADKIVFETGLSGGGGPLAVDPGRLGKLARVSPRGHPLDVMVAGDSIFPFRIGPTVRGVVAGLDRDKLRKMYHGEELWPQD